MHIADLTPIPPPSTDLPQLDVLYQQGNGPVWDRLAAVPPSLRAGRLGDSLLLLKHADGRTVLGSRDFDQGILADLGTDIDPRFIRRRNRSLLQLSGAEHVRQRRLAAPAFKPPMINRMRSLMRNTVHRLLDEVPGAECDAVAAFTHPYPIPVICTALGVPVKDQPLFSHAAEAWTLAFFDPAAVPEGLAAHDRLDAYVTNLIQERRHHPGDDMFTSLITGEDDEIPSAEELTSLISALIMAGTDSPRIQLASALEYLSRRPDLWQLLHDKPELVPAAVEELTRLTPVAGILRRVATRNTAVNGIGIPAGTRISLAISVMNRDPDVFDAPHTFDLTRVSGAPLSFGAGAHHCIGRQLARAELTEAITTLTSELSSFRPAAPPEWRPVKSLQGPRRLPIRFTHRRPLPTI
ncbi:cytochrome P450 [Streptomyces sp. NPDC050523]|uniref:cytochrome P450 n=1 Tax=Streptomyces sp. NPDC050523 TaxID=3365622 RepID=UPI0037B060EE